MNVDDDDDDDDDDDGTTLGRRVSTCRVIKVAREKTTRKVCRKANDANLFCGG